MVPLLKDTEDWVTSSVPHAPVLLRETLELLSPAAGATVVDATLGPGGHSEALLEAVGPDGLVLGVDRDPAALAFALTRLAPYGQRFRAIHGLHDELPELLRGAGVFAVDAILFDLGISSLQLDDPLRGFAFSHDGPLDMRMNPTEGRTAAELLAEATEGELRDILRRHGEERRAGAIARAIVTRRARQPIRTTAELAELVSDVLGPGARRYRIHPATRTFQALRIAVNHEIEALERTVTDAVMPLRRGGRIAVIAYHSLEDRAVKQAFRKLAERCICPPRLPVCGCGREDVVRLLTTRPVRPSADEVAANPRARSARLRAAERL